MKVPFIDLKRHHGPLQKELLEAFQRVFNSNQFILGAEVEQFEKDIASYVGCNHAIGVSNCTNALLLSLRALGIESGDEVITTPFTFVATAEVIAIIGAKPVFCDIEPKTYNMDVRKIPALISRKTKAIMPVHLYGQAADMDEIMDIAKEHKLCIIEDMAQAIGAKYKGKMIGTFGDTACISFFPTKNLCALGDAGMVLAKDKDIAAKLRGFRVHGAAAKYQHDYLGYNDRLDAVQAAFLRVKLKHLDNYNKRRFHIAKKYDNGLRDVVQVPFIHAHNETIYHQYTIRTQKRDEVRKYMTEHGIDTAIHYPLSLHLQPAFRYLGYAIGDFPEAEQASREVLSLPIQQDLSDEEVEYVIATIREFFR